jgi:D-alanyl-D-alanine carboxypeptidase/D-alanyl-D-alanine-endopeptidase (penicillin-binding protein 4)
LAAAGVTATPVLSVRRLPGWIESTVATSRLRRSLAALMASPALGPATPTSCLVVSQAGRLLYAANPSEALVPASNMKLLTATAVLDRLGATDRLTTRVTGGRPVGGVVHGDLYLVGGGDPLLRTPGYVATLGPDQAQYTSLAALAAQVQQAGVRVVTGGVVGDETRYDQARVVPTWSPVYAAEGDVAPLSALDVNDGTAAAVSLGRGASGPAAGTADPATNAAATFTALLRADGVAVSRAPETGKAPSGLPTLTGAASPPLAEEVDDMLRVSDDTAAELFTKELGYQATGTGSTAAGTAAIRTDLAAHGLPVSQLVAADGSGLDRGDRVTCTLLNADLQREGAHGVLARGLPVAGRTGTLRQRLAGTPAAGRLLAKTGTLNDVIGLSGFVLPKPGQGVPGTGLGQPVVFALVLNGVSSENAGRAAADRVGLALALYPQIPPLAALGPRR